MFINYSTEHGISVSTSRIPNALEGDIVDLVVAVECANENVTCSLEGAKDALEEGALWANTGISQTTLEMLHNAITDTAIT